MKVQILYFDGCPNHQPAVDLVREVLADVRSDATLEEVEVHGPEDSQELRFLGSPTILVDGLDIEPDARSRKDYGFSCRTYNGTGLPAREMVVAAVKGHDYTSGESTKKTGAGRWALGGSVIAAVVASACCWLPLLLITLGASAGGIGVVFERTRPVFLGLAAVLLTIGFYFTYLRKEKCAPGAACETPNPKRSQLNRILFWVAAVGVVAFALFPSYVGVFQPAPAIPIPVNSSTAAQLVTLKVDGMSCEGCAVNLHNELVKVAGVLNAEVQFEQGTALVSVNSAVPPSTESLLAAVEKAGYRTSLTHP